MLEIPNINYFLILIECLFFAGLMPKKRKMFLIITGLQLILLLALRDASVGVDTRTYQELFYYAVNGNVANYLEIGNQAVLWSFAQITDNPVVVDSFYAVITIVPVLWFIYKRSKNIYFSVVIYASFMFYYWTFNAMRQALAISICLVGIELLCENKNIKFIICIVIATCFHSSAIVMLICLFLKKWNIQVNKNWIIWIAGISTAFALFSRQLVTLAVKLMPQYAQYLDNEFVENGNYLHPILYGCIFAFLCLVRTKRQSKEDSFCLMLISIGVAIYFMSIGIQIVGRMTYYFTIPILVVLPNIIEEVEKQQNRIIYKMCFYLFFSIYEILLIFKQAQGIVPYKFFWQ